MSDYPTTNLKGRTFEKDGMKFFVGNRWDNPPVFPIRWLIHTETPDPMDAHIFGAVFGECIGCVGWSDDDDDDLIDNHYTALIDGVEGVGNSWEEVIWIVIRAYCKKEAKKGEAGKRIREWKKEEAERIVRERKEFRDDLMKLFYGELRNTGK